MQRKSRSKLTFPPIGLLSLVSAKPRSEPKGATVKHARHYMHCSYYNKHMSLQIRGLQQKQTFIMFEYV